MAFDPNQLLNNPASLMAILGAQAKKKEPGPPPPVLAPGPAPATLEGVPGPAPFDKGLYRDAFSRLGLLHIANVADLGCGQGNFTSVMADKRQKTEVYIGVDQNLGQIQVARKAYPGWRFVYGDFQDPKVRQEYERFEAYLLLGVLDGMADDLGFLESIPSGKHLVMDFRREPAEGSLRHFPDSADFRDRYSSLISIRGIGTYRDGGGKGRGMVVGTRW
jgi:SAM-dependent methyltransferase